MTARLFDSPRNWYCQVSKEEAIDYLSRAQHLVSKPVAMVRGSSSEKDLFILMLLMADRTIGQLKFIARDDGIYLEEPGGYRFFLTAVDMFTTYNAELIDPKLVPEMHRWPNRWECDVPKSFFPWASPNTSRLEAKIRNTSCTHTSLSSLKNKSVYVEDAGPTIPARSSGKSPDVTQILSRKPPNPTGSRIPSGERAGAKLHRRSEPAIPPALPSRSPQLPRALKVMTIDRNVGMSRLPDEPVHVHKASLSASTSKVIDREANAPPQIEAPSPPVPEPPEDEEGLDFGDENAYDDFGATDEVPSVISNHNFYLENAKAEREATLKLRKETEGHSYVQHNLEAPKPGDILNRKLRRTSGTREK